MKHTINFNSNEIHALIQVLNKTKPSELSNYFNERKHIVLAQVKILRSGSYITLGDLDEVGEK